jgi:DNA-binding CsgD family transcriptional regulator/PAS domain-containing protein
MSTDRSDLSELLGLLYEGLAFPERWPDFLNGVARRLQCDKAAIIFYDWEKQKADIGFSVGLSEEGRREYNGRYGGKSPILSAVRKALQKHGTWHGLAREVMDEAEYRRSEFYKNWARKHDLFHVVMAMWSQGPGAATSLSVGRPERAGPLGQDAVDLMGILTPHLRRAFHIHSRLEALRLSSQAAHAALENFGTAVIAVAADGSVVSLSGRAEALVERNDGVTLRRGKLTAADPTQAAEWERLLRSAAATGTGQGIGFGGAMLLKRRRVSQPLPVTVMPFHSSHVLTAEHPCALVFMNDPAERPPSRAALLSALYGLSPAECRFADLLVAETDLSRVAELMRVTVNTARFMVKSIFRKTQTNRQSQLVRLLMSLPAQIPSRK